MAAFPPQWNRPREKPNSASVWIATGTSWKSVWHPGRSPHQVEQRKLQSSWLFRPCLQVGRETTDQEIFRYPIANLEEPTRQAWPLTNLSTLRRCPTLRIALHQISRQHWLRYCWRTRGHLSSFQPLLERYFDLLWRSRGFHLGDRKRW